jgi:hypothetical protein
MQIYANLKSDASCRKNKIRSREYLVTITLGGRRSSAPEVLCEVFSSNFSSKRRLFQPPGGLNSKENGRDGEVGDVGLSKGLRFLSERLTDFVNHTFACLETWKP